MPPLSPLPPSRNLLKRLEQAVAHGQFKKAAQTLTTGATWGLPETDAAGQTVWVWPNQVDVWRGAIRPAEADSLATLNFLESHGAPTSPQALAKVVRGAVLHRQFDVVDWAESRGATLECEGLPPFVASLCDSRIDRLRGSLEWAFARQAVLVPPEAPDAVLRTLLARATPKGDWLWAVEELLQRGVPLHENRGRGPGPFTEAELAKLRPVEGNLLHVLAHRCRRTGTLNETAEYIAQRHYTLTEAWVRLELAGVDPDARNPDGETPWDLQADQAYAPILRSRIQAQRIRENADRPTPPIVRARSGPRRA